MAEGLRAGTAPASCRPLGAREAGGRTDLGPLPPELVCCALKSRQRTPATLLQLVSGAHLGSEGTPPHTTPPQCSAGLRNSSPGRNHAPVAKRGRASAFARRRPGFTPPSTHPSMPSPNSCRHGHLAPAMRFTSANPAARCQWCSGTDGCPPCALCRHSHKEGHTPESSMPASSAIHAQLCAHAHLTIQGPYWRCKSSHAGRYPGSCWSCTVYTANCNTSAVHKCSAEGLRACHRPLPCLPLAHSS